MTIFAGNPGAGKSTLLNSLAGRLLFQSGVSIGEGMTTVVKKERGEDGKMYGDTPGLDDITIREKAAEEINNILRSSDDIKLCFVITLESGRVRPADRTTIEVILDAIPVSTIDKFSIIINKLDASLADQLKNPDKLARILFGLGLTSEKHSTSHVHFMLKESAADDKDNVMLGNVSSLRRIVNSMPILHYKRSEVKDIKHDAFEAMREKFAADLEELKKLNASQLEEMARRHDAAMQKARADAEEDRKRFESRMDRMNEDHQRQLAVLNDRVAAANNRPGLLERILRAFAAIVD